MAAKTWATDFRSPAIQASIRNLGDAYHDDVFGFPGSFCIPVAEKPIVGWTPGRLMLVALVLGFLLLGTGALLATAVDKAGPGVGRTLLLTVAACCSLSGIAVFFLPVKLDRHILSWLIGDRARTLVHLSTPADIMVAELSNADRSKMKLSIDGDDYVLIAFDETNPRLMIEGIAARYQIRAADLEDLAPFEWMNYVGVELTYRIDSQTRLRVAIARVSMLRELIRQVPLLFFLRKKISNRLLEKCVRTLQPTDGDSCETAT